MRTGYWIDDGRIYGPMGFTGYAINSNNKIVGRQGDTRHWVYRKHIYSSKVGNTGFFIDGKNICGPMPQPPWESRGGRRSTGARRPGQKQKPSSDLPIC